MTATNEAVITSIPVQTTAEIGAPAAQPSEWGSALPASFRAPAGRLRQFVVAAGAGLQQGLDDGIGFRVLDRDCVPTIEAKYFNRRCNVAVSAFAIVLSYDRPLEIASRHPDHLADFLGLLKPDAEVDVTAQPVVPGEVAPRITMTCGNRTATLHTASLDVVARLSPIRALADGPSGVGIWTDPQHAPADTSTWENWADAGYVVAWIDSTEMTAVLDAARLVSGGLMRMNFEDGVSVDLGTRLTTNKRHEGWRDGDHIRFDSLSGTTTRGPKGVSIELWQKPTVGVLRSILKTGATEIVFALHPDEHGVNLIVTNRDDDGSATFGATAVVMRNRPKEAAP